MRPVATRERAAVLRHLGRHARHNLQLIEACERLGAAVAPGELPSELRAAWRGAGVVAVLGLRPLLALSAGAERDAVAALLAQCDVGAVGVLKCEPGDAARLWGELERRAPRRVLLDRTEIAYALEPSQAAQLGPIAALGAGLRPARESDFTALVASARASLVEEGRQDPWARDPRGFERWVRGRSARARLVDCDGEPAFVAYADVQRVEGWLLQGVFTGPRFRRRGLARAGIAALACEAFSAGAEHVQLSVVASNAAARALYEGLGFEPFAELRTLFFDASSAARSVG